MPTVCKHIHRLDLFEGVAVFGKVADIARHGGGVTGDIDNFLWHGGSDGVEQLIVAAFAGWVNDDKVGMMALAYPFGQPVFGFGC